MSWCGWRSRRTRPELGEFRSSATSFGRFGTSGRWSRWSRIAAAVPVEILGGEPVEGGVLEVVEVAPPSRVKSL